MQLASIGQNIPGEQLLSCANASRDNADSSETTYNKTHINVSVAIAGMVDVPQKYGEAREFREPVRVLIQIGCNGSGIFIVKYSTIIAIHVSSCMQSKITKYTVKRIRHLATIKRNITF